MDLLVDAIKEMVSQFIIDMMELITGVFTDLLSCNLSLFEELFSVVGGLYQNVIVPMGIAILLMILVWQLFKSMFGNKLGVNAEEPIELLGRSAICLFFVVGSKPLVNYVLKIAGTPYQWVMGTEIKVQSFSEYVSALEGITAPLGLGTISIAILMLIMQFVVAWNYFKMLFVIAERYVLLGVFSYTAPLAFATGGSKSTNNILASWAKMFGGQVVLIILNAWCMKMFLSGYGNMMASGYGFTKFFVATLCLVGFCKITFKLDSYMAALGVNLGRPSPGIGAMGAAMMAQRMFSQAGRSYAGTEADSGGSTNSSSDMGSTDAMANGFTGPIPMNPTGGNMPDLETLFPQGDFDTEAPENTSERTNRSGSSDARSTHSESVLDEVGMGNFGENSDYTNLANETDLHAGSSYAEENTSEKETVQVGTLPDFTDNKDETGMDLNSGGIPDYSEVNSNLSDNEIDMTGMNSQEQGYSGTVQNPGMDGSYASQTSLEFEKDVATGEQAVSGNQTLYGEGTGFGNDNGILGELGEYPVEDTNAFTDAPEQSMELAGGSLGEMDYKADGISKEPVYEAAHGFQSTQTDCFSFENGKELSGETSGSSAPAKRETAASDVGVLEELGNGNLVDPMPDGGTIGDSGFSNSSSSGTPDYKEREHTNGSLESGDTLSDIADGNNLLDRMQNEGTISGMNTEHGLDIPGEKVPVAGNSDSLFSEEAFIPAVGEAEDDIYSEQENESFSERQDTFSNDFSNQMGTIRLESPMNMDILHHPPRIREVPKSKSELKNRSQKEFGSKDIWEE